MYCPDCGAAMPGAIPENPTLCPNCGDIHTPVERLLPVTQSAQDPEHVGRMLSSALPMTVGEMMKMQNARFCPECDAGGCMF